MSEPSKKAPELENFLEETFGRTTAIRGVPCKVCGEPTMMDATKLCNNCWELTTRSKGFLVLNTRSQGFCYFKELDPALEFYKTGLERGEPYLLLGVIKGKLPV